MNPPANFHFEGQKNNEQVLLLVRRHWFNILVQFIMVFFLIIVLLLSYIIIPLAFDDFSDIYHSGRLLSFIESLLAMFILTISFIIWIDYYFDIWIVTNQRIVNIEQNGLFHRTVSELDLPKIQDVTTQVVGLIPTFLNFGDVYIQTAAETGRFRFRQVPEPYKIKDLIMNLRKKQQHQESNDLGEMIQKKIHDEIHEEFK
jgi:hypothetical protein